MTHEISGPSRPAIHVAGHAVFRLARGRSLPSVSVPTGTAGDCPYADDEAEVAGACVAGEVAEGLAFGVADDDGPGGDRDHLLSLMDRCADARARKRLLDEAYSLAEQTLKERWPGLLAVAAALDQRRQMSQAEVEEVLRAAAVPATR